jgi:hypothetical protein
VFDIENFCSAISEGLSIRFEQAVQLFFAISSFLTVVSAAVLLPLLVLFLVLFLVPFRTYTITHIASFICWTSEFFSLITNRDSWHEVCLQFTEYVHCFICIVLDLMSESFTVAFT